MSLMYYDIAMLKKVKALYPETFFAAPEEIFGMNAKNHGGTKVVMPMIGVYRMPDISINTAYYNDMQVRNGVVGLRNTHRNIEFPGNDVASHILPVSLQYQIDVYSIKREICDGLAAELALEFYENPWVNVNLKCVSEECVQQFSVRIDESLSDNTSISEFDDTGRFYRLTLTVNIDQAYLFRVDKTWVIETVEVDYDSLEIEE